MIRRILYFIALAILLAACSSNVSTPEADTLPVLVVDEAHFQDETLVYEIPAGNGFVLDARNYTYQIPVGAGPVTANYLQLVEIAQEGEIFGMELSVGASRSSITADQLLPLTGTSDFGGFGAGQQFVIAIGNMNEERFIPLWTATIEVK
ncbi:MAG: hypothetical protein HZB19_21045 [Chloroflexi bacterium]|nr:hypothetical protein [Chloroflexota bacterium]